MPRLLLLAAVLLSASTVRGQVLNFANHFQVYEEEFSFFNSKTFHFQNTSSHRVNYLLTSQADDAGALQVRRHNTSDTSPLTATGGLLCQLTGIKYLSHMYERAELEEHYKGRYKAYRGGSVPPASMIPNPSSVEVRWYARCGDEYTLEVLWFLPKTTSDASPARSYCVYRLRCHSLD